MRGCNALVAAVEVALVTTFLLGAVFSPASTLAQGRGPNAVSGRTPSASPSVAPPAARRLLAGFGIVFGAEHVVIYIEPKETLDVRADRARSRIIINGEDVQEANWFETWGAEFREKMRGDQGQD